MAMAHDRILLDRVSMLRTRVRMLVAQKWLCLGLTAALAASPALVAATKFRWWTDAIDYIWAVALFGALAGLVYGWTRPIDALVAAQIADERAGLKERLSTAIELSRQETRSDLAEAQIADAARHASELQPSRVLPWKPPPQWRWLAAAAAALMAIIYVPELPVFHSRQEQMDREAIRMEGERLQRVAKQIEKKLPKGSDENAAILRRVQQQMKQLGKDMKNNRIPKKLAMLKANELQKELKEAENRLGRNGGKSTDRVAADLRDAARQKEAAGDKQAAEALRKMAESISQKDMDAAAKQLADMAQKMQSGQMKPEDAARAAEQLEQMAKAMEGSNLDKASQEMKEAASKLRQASEAARQMQQKLANAKSDAERRQIQQEMQQQVQQQLAQAGGQCSQAGGQCKNAGSSKQSDSATELSKALQSAQQSLQQAGQQQAGNGQNEASQEEMGQEFGQGGRQGQQGQQGRGQGQGQQASQGAGSKGGQRGSRSASGTGMGGPGRGVGGNAGAQQPLPGKKRDVLVSGTVDSRGKQLSRTYRGTPDPNKDRAAYYSIVPEKVRAAETALNREDIPTPVKKPVQRYFESIQPQDR